MPAILPDIARTVDGRLYLGRDPLLAKIITAFEDDTKALIVPYEQGHDLSSDLEFCEEDFGSVKGVAVIFDSMVVPARIRGTRKMHYVDIGMLRDGATLPEAFLRFETYRIPMSSWRSSAWRQSYPVKPKNPLMDRNYYACASAYVVFALSAGSIDTKVQTLIHDL